MSIRNRLKLTIIGFSVLVIISCLLLFLSLENRTLDNPMVITIILLAIVWNILLLPVGLSISKKFCDKLDSFIYSSSELAEGNANLDIEISNDQSDLSLLNLNLEIIRKNMENASVFAKETGNGNLDVDFEVSSENDLLGSALLSMREKLIEVAKEDKRRSWFNEGIAQFSEILRRNNDNLEILCTEIITNLIHKINAQQGTIFVKEELNGSEVMTKKATYAFNRDKYLEQTVYIKEGLVGQVWAEKKPTYIEDVPQNYVSITSGLGGATASSIFIVPLFVKDNVMGVIEIASLEKIKQYQQEFILKVAESIASTLDSVKTNVQTVKLLEDSQNMQKEMANQEEMMKQSMEEMRATQEQLLEQENELKAANDEIRNNQRELESRIKILNEMCLVSITDRKGVITEVNQKFMEVAKYSENELINQPHNVVRHPDMPAEIFKLMWQTIGKGQPFRGMVKNRAKDGSTYWVDAVINPIIGENGKPEGYIGVRYLNTDIIQKQDTFTYDLGDQKFTIPTA